MPRHFAICWERHNGYNTLIKVKSWRFIMAHQQEALIE
jgi:hypothetical protein